MSAANKLRIIVIDDDPSILALLKNMLASLGHHVLAFPDPTACPVYKKPECQCPQEFPCADVVIADIMMPNMTGIDFFRLMRRRGCKALDANKALMSAATTPDQRDAVAELGCHFIRKPFKVAEVTKWLTECADRLPEGRILAKLG